jgi:hypothetical protein
MMKAARQSMAWAISPPNSMPRADPMGMPKE